MTAAIIAIVDRGIPPLLSFILFCVFAGLLASVTFSVVGSLPCDVVGRGGITKAASLNGSEWYL